MLFWLAIHCAFMAKACQALRHAWRGDVLGVFFVRMAMSETLRVMKYRLQFLVQQNRLTE